MFEGSSEVESELQASLQAKLDLNIVWSMLSGLESEMESGRSQLERQSKLLGELRLQLTEVKERWDM